MKCKICGKRIKLKKENRYEIVSNLTGLKMLYESPKTYECFDCTHCGCQHIVNIRETMSSNDEYPYDEEEEENEDKNNCV